MPYYPEYKINKCCEIQIVNVTQHWIKMFLSYFYEHVKCNIYIYIFTYIYTTVQKCRLVNIFFFKETDNFMLQGCWSNVILKT